MVRRKFTAEFKTKIVLEILREEKQIGEVATENGLSPNQLRNWRKEFLKMQQRCFLRANKKKIFVPKKEQWTRNEMN